MGWIISFALSWILFLLCVERDNLWPSVIGGICAVIIQFFTDKIFIGLKLYIIHEGILCVNGSGSIFFTLGPVFTMGTLMVQYLPQRRSMKFLNVFIWAIFFILFERTMLAFGYLEYQHWSQLYSFWIDVMALADISWIGEIFARQKR